MTSAPLGRTGEASIDSPCLLRSISDASLTGIKDSNLTPGHGPGDVVSFGGWRRAKPAAQCGCGKFLRLQACPRVLI